MIRLIRWLLILPMATLGWVLAFIGALAAHSLVDTLCPPQYQFANSCTSEWFALVMHISVVSGAFVSAVLFVSVAALVAPDYKQRVAIGAFLVGLTAAIWAYAQTDALPAFIGACTGGLLTLMIILSQQGRRSTDGYREYHLSG